MGALQVRVLGRPAVDHAGTPVPLGRKALALVGYLAVTGEAHSRRSLAGLLWSDHRDDRARANLRMTLTELRRALPGHLAISQREVGPTDDWQVARRGLLAPAEVDVDDTDDVHDAASLELFAEFDLGGTTVFDAWLAEERERVRRLLGDRVAARAAQLAVREPDRALRLAREVLALDPLDEGAHRLVMEQLARTGRRGAALAQYETCRALLADALGVDPSPETSAVRDRLLDLDGSVPEAGQLGPPDAAELAGIADRASPPRDVEVARDGPLVGREQELARVESWLADEAVGVVTLLGPGGVGKSRLADEVAARTVACGGPCTWIALGALRTGSPVDAIASAVARALGVPPGKGSPLDAVRRGAAAAPQLVVLDNAEHLEVAPVAVALSGPPSRCRVLVTSRARLGLGAEWVLPLAGLAVPAEPTDDPAAWPAVALLVDRLRRLQPDLDVETHASALVDICRLVGGSPLALQLAAEWGRSLDPPAIAALIATDLDALATSHPSLPVRQRSMRSVLDASWDLVDEHRRAVLTRIAVLDGTFDEVTARVVGAATPADLATLVDRSLLTPSPGGRFGLHELVRQHARDRLAADPSASRAARAARAARFVALARAVVDEDATVDERDLPDLRAVAAELVEGGDEDDLAVCLDALWHLDGEQGRLTELRALLDAALARDGVSPARRRSWHLAAGTAAFHLGRMAAARDHLEATLDAAGVAVPRSASSVTFQTAQQLALQAAHRARRRAASASMDRATDDTIDALSLLVNTLYNLQETRSMAVHVLRAANLADRGAAPAGAAAVYAELAFAASMYGWHGAARRYGALADASAARAPASERTLLGLEARVLTHLAVADWGGTDTVLARARAAHQVTNRRLSWLAMDGLVALVRGPLDRAQVAFEEGLELADLLGEELAWVWCATGVIDARLRRGAEAAELVELAAAALDRARSLSPAERFKTTAILATLRACEGRSEEAVTLCAAAERLAATLRPPPVWALAAYTHTVELRVTARADGRTGLHGDPGQALSQLRRFARVHPVARPRAAWATGAVATAAGRDVRAARWFRRGIEVADELGLPYDAARCHLGLATVVGGREADEHLGRGRALAASVGAVVPGIGGTDAALTPA
jgi:DNA-binding SARP family transcriptional activator/predicted ATPase